MIEQTIKVELIHIPFQAKKFFSYIAIAVIIGIASLYLTEKFPQIGNFPLLLIFTYFIPSFVAFDFINEYKDSHSVPVLNHPRKVLILVLNLLTGWTVIGWLIALYMALTPGLVTVERVEYLETK